MEHSQRTFVAGPCNKSALRIKILDQLDHQLHGQLGCVGQFGLIEATLASAMSTSGMASQLHRGLGAFLAD